MSVIVLLTTDTANSGTYRAHLKPQGLEQSDRAKSRVRRVLMETNSTRLAHRGRSVAEENGITRNPTY